MTANEAREARTPAGDALTNLVLCVFRANGRLLRAGDTFGRDLGVTAARWQVMGAIDGTAKTASQIAREFELTRQGVLWVVQALLKDGLVELIDNPDHRRAKLVCLTAQGQAIYDELDRRQRRWINQLGSDFDIPDVQSAIALIEQLGAQGAIRAADDVAQLGSTPAHAAAKG